MTSSIKTRQASSPAAPTTQIFSRVTAKLLHRTTFMMDKLVEAVLQETTDITLSQFLMLMQMSGGHQCQREMASALGVTPAAISRQVSQMVDLGYLKRIEHEHDRRFEFFSLTPKGKRVFAKATKSLEQDFAKVYDGLSAADRQAIHLGLTKLMGCYEVTSTKRPVELNSS